MDQVSLRDYCDETRSFIQAGEFDRAIHITRHILRHYAWHVESYRLLGQALLEMGDHQEAAKQFRRVLSADPEDIISRVGLAKIHEAVGDLDKATWQMRRAFDLSPGDSHLRQQLHRLVNNDRQDDTQERIDITRAALGRIHAGGGLHAKAVQEFKAVLAQEPDRFDVQVALAEALWRAGQHLEATEVCYHILEKHPNALKANLIIGAMGLDSRQADEAESHLKLAQALDPENIVAQSLFGEKSPLAPLTIKIERLDEVEIERDVQLNPPPTLSGEGAPPSRGLEPTIDGMSELREEETTPMSDKEQPDEGFELPDWLQGVGDDLLEEKDVQAVASTPAEASAEGEVPDWLRNLAARSAESPPGETPATPDEPSPTEPGDVPDWLQELRPEVTEDISTDTDTPDWLATIAAGEPLEETQPEPAPDAAEPSLEPTASEVGQADWPSEEEESKAQAMPPEAAGEPAVGVDEGRAMWEEILAEEGVDLASAEEMRPPEAEGMTAEEWLRSTTDLSTTQPDEGPQEEPTAEPLPETPTLPAAEAEVGEAGLPDWFKELEEPLLSAEAGEEVAETPPASVEEIGPTELEPIGDFAEESEVPDWLREVAAGEPVVPEAAEPVAEAPPEVEVDEGGLPDWLQDFTQLPGEDIEPETQPVSPEAAGEPVARADEGRAMWEEILAEEGVDLASAEEMRPPEAEGMTAEEWLRSTTDLSTTQPDEGPQEPAAEPLPETPTLPAAEVEVDEAELPDWLRDFEEPVGEEELELLAAEAKPAAEVEADVGELPDWLRETKEPPAAEAEPGEPGVPDWLRQVAAGEPVPAEEGEPTAPTAEDEVPDWLAEARESPELSMITAEVVERALDEVEAEEAEAGLPDWLRELKEPAPEVEPTAEEYPEARAEEVEALEAEVDEEGLPDWLRKPLAEIETEAPEGGVGPATEMPEWLKALETESMPLAEPTFDEPIEMETGEMPEWLGEVMAKEPPLTEEWGEPEAPEPVEAEVPEEQVPDWLRDFREEGKEAAAEPAAEAGELEAPAEVAEPLEGEAQPEMPNWLRRLREGIPEEAPPTPAEQPTAEAEGAPAEVPVEAVEYPPSLPAEEGEAIPAEPEAIQAEAGVPEWLGELVRDDESLAELEAIEEIEEEMATAEAVSSIPPVEHVEVEEVEAVSPEPPEGVEVEAPPARPDEPVEAPEPAEPLPADMTVTRLLEPIQVEDLPKDPAARLAMARAARNAGDWSDALVIYETLVNASELLDSVIDDLEAGTRKYLDEAAGYQLLGDACMKDGRLQDALQAYRSALTKL
jgi:tetratricopeptide (TPR) repeat protein